MYSRIHRWCIHFIILSLYGTDIFNFRCKGTAFLRHTQEKSSLCKRDGTKNRLSDGTIDKKAELTLLKGE